MAHNSSENLIQSDSSTSTDELNNSPHSRSVGKVSKKMFHRKKTAFAGGANSVTSSSVTSSPQQHPIIVVGTADVHRAVSPPKPKPLPRKQLPIDSMGTNRKQLAKVDDVVEMSVSGDSESNNSEQGKATVVVKREEIELHDFKSPSGSSGAHSDGRIEESKMFFARSRKNTIVTNIDEISTKSSCRTDTPVRSESKSQEEMKPLPKPRQHIQSQYEIVHEKPSKKEVETPAEHHSMRELSQSNSIDSNSETCTESEIGNSSTKDKSPQAKAEEKIDPGTIQQDDVITRLIGIYIHSSSELKFDYNVHRPMVRCSIIDTTSGHGQLLRNRKVNGKSQPQGLNEKDNIQAVMTKGCRFTSSSIFQCQWEQLLIINESITQLMHDHIIIFFEILDTPSSESDLFFSKVSREKNDWHYVCWGFLRPGDGTKSSNVDRRCCLQLYRYQRRHLLRKCSLNVYDQFGFNRIRYPATLTVTVKGIIPSQSPLDLPKEGSNQPNTEFRNIKFDAQKITDTENAGIATANFPRRLPGQICKYPNTIHQTHLQPSSKGCLASKFSPNGQFLAYSFCSDYNIQIATVPDLKVLNTLRGHTNFVYDLDWLADKRKNSFPLHLVSASSDRTAVVWTIEKDSISLTILPHPSFLYAAKFLVNLSTDGCCLFAVTGGRDCTIRVWKVGPDHNFDLLQESNDHDENYITSIVCPTKTNGFYSSDWNGLIFEWSYQTMSNIFQVTRKFPKLNEGISSLQLHPKNEQRLYAQLKTRQIVCLDASNEIVLNYLGSTDDDQRINNKFTISPCGSTIYTILGDTIVMYNILTGSVQSSLNVPHVKHQRGSYISHLDYHPKLFLLCATVYGPNGGIVLLTHKTDGPVEAPVRQDSFDDRWMLLKQNVHPKSSELFGTIIRRIDDILHQPQHNKNETDDFKNENLANRNQTHADNDQNVADGAVGEVGSLTIVSENDSDIESGGTFTVRSRSISEVSNRTFTLNKNADGTNASNDRINDGTYSIKGDSDSDDTTIDESM